MYYFKCGLCSLLFALLVCGKPVNGDSCKTPNGENAQCVSIYNCPILYAALTDRNPQTVRFLRQSQCGYDNGPLVCCGSAANFQNATPRPQRPTNSGLPNNSILPTRATCGFQEGVRVLGGTKTDYNEFPWMVLLQYRKNSGGMTFSCGGAIISDKYILTAAHCVTGQILSKVGTLSSVRFGEWDTTTDKDCVTVKGFELCNDEPVDIGVDKTIPHPDYNDNSISRYHDIALVRLKRRITYTPFIQPICLPSSNEHAGLGEKLWVSGWGRTEYANFSPVKLKVGVPIVSNNQCAKTFKSAGVDLAASQLCAGGEKNKDSCNGDSGGPLMNTTPNDTAQWYVEGVVSFGTRCGTQNWPGIYTRVSDYLPWIYDNVKP